MWTSNGLSSQLYAPFLHGILICWLLFYKLVLEIFTPNFFELTSNEQIWLIYWCASFFSTITKTDCTFKFAAISTCLELPYFSINFEHIVHTYCSTHLAVWLLDKFILACYFNLLYGDIINIYTSFIWANKPIYMHMLISNCLFSLWTYQFEATQEVL